MSPRKLQGSTQCAIEPEQGWIDSAVGMDHRWGRREPTDVAVRVIAKPGVTAPGRVLNISLTGAYLETRVPLRLLSIVYLEPATPTSDPSAGPGIAASVVRQDARGVGLEWLDVSAAAAKVSARMAILTGSKAGENIVSHTQIRRDGILGGDGPRRLIV